LPARREVGSARKACRCRRCPDLTPLVDFKLGMSEYSADLG
jgi:hypothetical protein